MSGAVRQAYEQWFKATQHPDAPAFQTIESRRSFYSGFVACVCLSLNESQQLMALAECEDFFEEEVATGFGVPKGKP